MIDVLVCYIVSTGKKLPTFRRIILHSRSESEGQRSQLLSLDCLRVPSF